MHAVTLFLTSSPKFLAFLSVSQLFSHQRQQQEMECVKQDVRVAILVYFILNPYSLA